MTAARLVFSTTLGFIIFSNNRLLNALGTTLIIKFKPLYAARSSGFLQSISAVLLEKLLLICRNLDQAPLAFFQQGALCKSLEAVLGNLLLVVVSSSNPRFLTCVVIDVRGRKSQTPNSCCIPNHQTIIADCSAHEFLRHYVSALRALSHFSLRVALLFSRPCRNLCRFF